MYSGSGALASERPQPGPEDSGGGGQRLTIHMQNWTRGVGPIIMQKVERFPLLRQGERSGICDDTSEDVGLEEDRLTRSEFDLRKFKFHLHMFTMIR